MSSEAQAYTLFQQPWWLDAAARNRWDEVQIEEGGRVVARLPFMVKERLGFRALVKPKLTQTLGPWTLEYPGEKPATALNRQNELYRKLIQALPKHDLFWQNFAPQVTNWQPFYWEHFSQSTRYTYALDLAQSENDLYGALSKSKRQDIRRAEKSLVIDRTCGVDDLMALVRMTFSRRELPVPYSLDYLERIHAAVDEHGIGSILVARDRVSGQPHGATYTISDGQRTYLLVSGQNPELRHSGSGALLTWTAIKDSMHTSSVFDFEGSMMKEIASFYRGFGGRQVPYFEVERFWRGGPVAAGAFGIANASRRGVRRVVQSARRN